MGGSSNEKREELKPFKEEEEVKAEDHLRRDELGER